MDTTPTPALLLLDLPPKSLAGIDLLSFTTAPKFKGIKNVPPGWHFAFASPNTSFSLRHGVWFYISKPEPGTISSEVVVMKWESNTESLLPETSKTELMRHRANLSAIWKDGLSPYRQSAGAEGDETTEEDRDAAWADLTSHLSSNLLTRLLGPQSIPGSWMLSSAHSAEGDVDDLSYLLGPPTGPRSRASKRPPSVELDSEQVLHFTPIDLKHTWRPGATGRERTTGARDRSWALNDIITRYCDDDENELTGELQFCFLMVLTLNNYACLEQWKRIYELLLTCRWAAVRDENEVTPDGAPAGRAKLFVNALRLLQLQLDRAQDVAEGGLIDLSDDGDSSIATLLRKFRKSIDEMDGHGKKRVVTQCKLFEEWAQKDLGWQMDDDIVKRGMIDLEDGERIEVRLDKYDEEDEEGEFAPTMVELTDDQLRMLGDDYSQDTPMDSEEDSDDMDARY